MFPVVELIRVSVGSANFPNRGSQAQRRPGKGAQVQGLASGHRDIGLFKSSDHAGTESPKVIGAWQNIRDGETAACSRFDPELAGEILLLEIHSAVNRRQTNPKAHR
jgi:hypothetical protein